MGLPNVPHLSWLCIFPWSWLKDEPNTGINRLVMQSVIGCPAFVPGNLMHAKFGKRKLDHWLDYWARVALNSIDLHHSRAFKALLFPYIYHFGIYVTDITQCYSTSTTYCRYMSIVAGTNYDSVRQFVIQLVWYGGTARWLCAGAPCIVGADVFLP